MNQPTSQTNFARNLRHNQTDAERALWQKIRSKQFLGIKFRRQFPIGNYIVDFVSIERKLIIELDGSQHGTKTGRRYDKVRTKFLEQEGYLVIRFWDNDVLKNIDQVLEALTLTLSRKAGEGIQ